MANGIRIVTDSTSDLPPEFVKENNITVVPLYVNFPDQTYLDGVNIQPREFYPMLERSGDKLPKTSTPTIDDFVRTYKALLSECHEILSIHISSGLSSTASIAEAAARTLSERIHVFDSKSISLGIGLQVLEAVEMIRNNLTLEHIKERLVEIRRQTETLFSLDTLEYLEKGGRIGKVSALLGSVLKIKPVIRVDNGIYVPLDRVRNQGQAIQKLIEHMVRILDGNLPRHVAVAHGAAPNEACTLVDCLEKKLGIKPSLFRETGPVIGVHTGPGALGLAFTY